MFPDLTSLLLHSASRLALGILIALPIGILISRILSTKQSSIKTLTSSSAPHQKDPNAYEDIEPLVDFDWRAEPPIRNAPLKPKYHLTMALETLPLSHLIAMDNTYLTRLQTRTSIIKDHYPSTIQCNETCTSAVYELYSWLFSTYLPRRFPTIYHLTPTKDSLYNTATSKTIPISPLPATPQLALQILGENVDTDFLILLPSSTSTTPEGNKLPIYHLEAFVTCFPTGFSTLQKLGLPLAQIHTPVPGYKAKLERSMDKFFAKMGCGKMVKRGNWSLTTNADLFAESGSHLYEDGKTETDVRAEMKEKRNEDALGAEIEKQKKEVIIKECRLRSERQTLFRLPKSKALVFSFKTYQYSLEEVKRDGYAERLAEAMEGLREGNVPEMDFYKRGVVWREPVIKYLRS